MNSLKVVALTGAIAVVCGIGAVQAGVERADRADSLYTSLGSQPAYAAVGRVDGSTASSGFIASGTLISDSWVLTAGHVVDDATRLNFSVGGKSYTADKWVANPNWTGNLWAGYDLGLMHLTQAVGNVAPAVRYTGTKEQGQTATTVGYGMTGTGLTGSTTFDGKKRAGQNVIDLFYNSRLFLSDFDNPNNRRDSYSGSATPLNLEYLIAPGDSGGGAFLTIGGVTYLAGVNSFVAALDGKANSDYGDVSGQIRVSAFTTWINSVLGSITTTSLTVTDTTGATVTDYQAIPEPASLALLTAGSLLLLARRRSA